MSVIVLTSGSLYKMINLWLEIFAESTVKLIRMGTSNKSKCSCSAIFESQSINNWLDLVIFQLKVHFDHS